MMHSKDYFVKNKSFFRLQTAMETILLDRSRGGTKTCYGDL